ncbi:hypothetical protein FB45DRAFT_929537 [Roridomyces roridus]|uniref:HD domain-containing protein n=1 Tax=Roridomyces roridus TaxID=1738132 RepID=A0AAD7FI53_9AGAR|nr:hypothetical protein FB45DRAFT_929537 [Roridomyces roridus]
MDKTFDAFVPSTGPALIAISNLTAAYVPFTTLQAIPINSTAHAASFAYAKRLTPPSVFGHLLRCFYFGLAFLYTGFPSNTPGVAQIGFEELATRFFHTTLLHDLGWSTLPEALNHPAHAMTFELHEAIMAYDHLHAVAPELDAHQVGDIAQSIVLHTSGDYWQQGNSSANQILMFLTAFFDVGGYDGLDLEVLNFTGLWNPQTVQEIEAAYPRGNFSDGAAGAFEREFTDKPNCLLSHFPGGLAGLDADLLVGPIVPVKSTNVRRVSRDPHLHYAN